MHRSSARTMAIATFALGVLIVATIFAVADVSMGLIVGPVLVVGVTAYASFRTALTDPR